jgi:hypothetical protein
MASIRVLSGAVALALAGVLQVAGFPGLTGRAQAQNTRGRRGPPPVPRRVAPASIRMPRGIYAVVVMDGTRSADLKALLNNPAVSGLAIRMFWSSLQPAPNHYDFKSLDAAFDSAAAAHKTVQLILVPGFGTPDWVLNELSSCDSSLSAPVSGGGGGKGGGGVRGSAAGSSQTSSTMKIGRASCRERVSLHV